MILFFIQLNGSQIRSCMYVVVEDKQRVNLFQVGTDCEGKTQKNIRMDEDLGINR